MTKRGLHVPLRPKWPYDVEVRYQGHGARASVQPHPMSQVQVPANHEPAGSMINYMRHSGRGLAPAVQILKTSLHATKAVVVVVAPQEALEPVLLSCAKEHRWLWKLVGASTLVLV